MLSYFGKRKHGKKDMKSKEIPQPGKELYYFFCRKCNFFAANADEDNQKLVESIVSGRVYDCITETGRFIYAYLYERYGIEVTQVKSKCPCCGEPITYIVKTAPTVGKMSVVPLARAPINEGLEAYAEHTKPVRKKPSELETVKITAHTLQNHWFEDDHGNKWFPPGDEHDGPEGFNISCYRDCLVDENMFALKDMKKVISCKHEKTRPTGEWVDGLEGRECLECHGTQIREINKPWPDEWDATGSKHIMGMHSSFDCDLVLAMCNSGDYKLYDAIMIAATACTACMNVLAHAYGLDWGYEEYSDEWKKTNTSCHFCNRDTRIHEAMRLKQDTGSCGACTDCDLEKGLGCGDTPVGTSETGGSIIEKIVYSNADGSNTREVDIPCGHEYGHGSGTIKPKCDPDKCDNWRFGKCTEECRFHTYTHEPEVIDDKGIPDVDYPIRDTTAPLKVFLDMEFTGLHKWTSLISLGAVAETGETIYLEFADFDKQQINEWLHENVIKNLTMYDPGVDYAEKWHISRSVLEKHTEGCALTAHNKSALKVWFELLYAEYGRKIEIWLDCGAYDWILFVDLMAGYRDGYPSLPEYINYIPMDISTLFGMFEGDSDTNRLKFINGDENCMQHNALYDAIVIKECYNRLNSYWSISPRTLQSIP